MKKRACTSTKISITFAGFTAVAIVLLFTSYSILVEFPTFAKICTGQCDRHTPSVEIVSGTKHTRNLKTKNSVSDKAIPTPPPISAIHTVSKSQFSRFSNHSFYLPLVYKAYVRPSLHRSSSQPNAVDVFLFTKSLYFRKLKVSHCLVGDKLYPVQSFSVEVTFCILPEFPVVKRNSIISVIIDSSSEGLEGTLFEHVKFEGGYILPPLVQGRDIIPYRKSSSKPDFVIPADAVSRTEYINNGASLLLGLPSEQYVKDILIDDFDPVHADSGKRYAVCMSTMTATSPHLIVPWVDYHRTIGIDHVYIFDNGLNVDLTTMFGTRTDVEIIPWPWRKTQNQATSFMILAARRRCDILFKPDTDEYVLPGLLPDGAHSSDFSSAFAKGRRPLHEFLRNRRERFNWDSFQIKALKLCNSGYVKIPSKAPPIAYTHARDGIPIHTGKSFCKTMLDYRRADIHPCGAVGPRVVSAPFGKELSQDKVESIVRDVDTEDFWGNYATPTTVSDTAWLMHFYERSWEEWSEKWSIGTAASKHTGRDSRIGTFSASKPDPKFIDKNNGRCREYTFFRNVFQKVMEYKNERVEQSVVVWNENSTPRSTIVSVWANYSKIT